MRSPASPHLATGTEQSPENERSLLRVAQMLAARSGLDLGLPARRPLKPLLLPGARPARTYFLLQSLAGRLLSLDTRVDLIRGKGFPEAWLSGAGTLGESPERLLVVSMALFA